MSNRYVYLIEDCQGTLEICFSSLEKAYRYAWNHKGEDTLSSIRDLRSHFLHTRFYPLEKDGERTATIVKEPVY